MTDRLNLLSVKYNCTMISVRDCHHSYLNNIELIIIIQNADSRVDAPVLGTFREKLKKKFYSFWPRLKHIKS